MGVKHLPSRPFNAALLDSAAPGRLGQKFCGFRRGLPIGDYPCLLKLQNGSHRGAGGALPGALVGRAVLLDADPEVLGQLLGIGVGQSEIGALDAAQRGGGDLRRAASWGWVSPLMTRQSPGKRLLAGMLTTRSIGASMMRITRASRSTCGEKVPASQA